MLASRELANEVPVALEFNGEVYAVMMLTPSDLEDFAVGFALSERIIARASEIARIDVREGTRGIGVDVRLEKEHSARLAERRRSLPGQSGCGICGLTSIEEALPQLAKARRAAARLASGAVRARCRRCPRGRRSTRRPARFMPRPSARRTARSWRCARTSAGTTPSTRSPATWRARVSIPSGGFALLTSRCSYELVQKAVLARIPMLVTISAPTELAVSIAKEADLTLVALARGDSVLVFNDPFFVFPKVM